MIQAIFEDGVDASVTGAADGEGSFAGIFQALCAKGFFQAHDPEAGTKPLLWMRTRSEDGFDELLGGRSIFSCPPDKPLGGPFCVVLMGLRHVLADSGVLTLDF